MNPARVEFATADRRLRVIDGGKRIAENGGMAAAKKGAKASKARSGEASKERVENVRPLRSRADAEREGREFFAKVEEKFARLQSLSLSDIVSELGDIRMSLDRRGFTEASELLLIIEEHLSTHVISEMVGRPLKETISRSCIEKACLAATAKQRKDQLTQMNAYLAKEGKPPIVKRRPMSAQNALFLRLVKSISSGRASGMSDLKLADNTLRSIRNILRIDTSNVERASVVRKDPEAFVRAAYRAAGIERVDNVLNAKSKQRSRAHRAKRTDI